MTDLSSASSPYAVQARGLVKRFGDFTAVDGVDLSVPTGSIYGILGPNGAGKTTLIRMLIGIIDPDGGARSVLGADPPMRVAAEVGYLPEERGLYPSMKAIEAIAFMGALRGLSLAEGRRRGREMLESHGLSAAADKQIRHLSKGMAQTVQLLGSIIHRPKLIVLDEPFSGLDAINQQKLEKMIRAEAAGGATILFSTHVIAHAERLCERVAIVARGRIRFDGTVEEARGRLAPQVRLETRAGDGPWRAALPADAIHDSGAWRFSMPEGGMEPLLKALIDADAGILALSIERPGLHDAFVAIAGAAAAEDMGSTTPEETEPELGAAA